MSEGPRNGVRVTSREIYDLLLQVHHKVTAISVELALHRWVIGVLLTAVVGLVVKVVITG